MRLTLEQLKAMGDEGLRKHWTDAKYPFDLLKGCSACITQHTYTTVKCSHHHLKIQTIAILGVGFYARDDENTPTLRENLEQLYALRLFYDSLYPQAASVVTEEMELPVCQEHGS